MNLLGLIGYPLKHSLSHILHNTAAKILKLPYRYFLFEVPTSRLADAILGIRALNIKGINVTLPYKTDVIPYLDEVSSQVRAIEAVNTIKNDEGKLIGFNTDCEGFLYLLREHKLKVESALLIGAGGAGKAVAWALALYDIPSLHIFNRTEGRAYNIKYIINSNFKSINAEVHPLSEIDKYLNRAELIINATSVGLSSSDPWLFDYRKIPKPATVIDIIYNPQKTPLLEVAQASGAMAINGLDMFVYQGAYSFKIWTGHMPPLDKLKEVLLKSMEGCV